MKKKISLVLLVIMVTLLCSACGKKEENIKGNLPDLMNKLYENLDGFSTENLQQVAFTKDEQEYFIGDVSFDYKEALASEPVMSSVAHSVVLIRLNSAKDAEKAKKEIKEKVNPRKWICVEVEEKEHYYILCFTFSNSIYIYYSFVFEKYFNKE
mgnify:CR=1 FL=1